MYRLILLYLISLPVFKSYSQTAEMSGKVTSEGKVLEFANVSILHTRLGASADSAGFYRIHGITAGNYQIRASAVGFKPVEKNVRISENQEIKLDFDLSPSGSLDEVVVTGTLKEVSRLESPAAVEIYTPAFFKKNPTPSVFDALQQVNGVRPQLNCNLCNTGDIHINGLEGPYTMVLIDGMPIVSGLSTVYGLSGIPNALIERIEIVKGPASSLYGSEAVGGLINIITKKPAQAPRIYADAFATSWQEYNTDLGFKFDAGKKASVLTGVNYFKYANPVDKNKDHFTDVTLQDRISLFQKWSFNRKENRLFSAAARYYYEDRWGGEMDWTKKYRGGEEVYGESIYTKRWEFLGSYQLPLKEKILFSFSYNDHDQNSVYGSTPYMAQQRIGFGQLTWDKKLGKHDLVAGLAFRYTWYDDNTPATADTMGNNLPDKIKLPGIFLQDEIVLSHKHKLLAGFRYDRNPVHGNIYTPRLAYKFDITDKDILRLNAGTGYRVVNLFTEDHAALTGAREVVIVSDLHPEKSWNVNLNYVKKIYFKNGAFIGLDASAWYTHFQNQILADYDTNPNQIIYNNLEGHAVSRGISTNFDLDFMNGLKVIAGATFMDVFKKENAEKERPVLTERWTGTWAISYKIPKFNLGLDYTGNIYGPMRLPLLGELDPRSEYSKTWSIQNLQLSLETKKGVVLYGGVKNLLNWTPAKDTPFLISRSHDPFDEKVEFSPDGVPLATPENPYALTFDPNYVYGPNQGIRGFAGIRVSIR